MFGERKREIEKEREIVFRKRKKECLEKIGENQRILVLLFLNILSMDKIKNKK